LEELQMKKKILGSIIVLAIAAVAAFNVNLNTPENDMSTLSLANVEALSQENLPDLPPIKYLSMRLDCFNWQGVVIGSRTACYVGGGSPSCNSTNC
jgi:hypothetical protein